jgi:hypothetical protein
MSVPVVSIVAVLAMTPLAPGVAANEIVDCRPTPRLPMSQWTLFKTIFVVHDRTSIVGCRAGGERTVKAHLTSVFQQLGVTDRTQAALWAKTQLVGPFRPMNAPTELPSVRETARPLRPHAGGTPMRHPQTTSQTATGVSEPLVGCLATWWWP